MKKRIILCCIGSLLLLSISAQDTFAKLYKIDSFYNTIFNAILVTDSVYFVTGITVDSAPPYMLGSLRAKIGLDGEIIDLQTYRDLSGQFETWHQGLFYNNQDNTIANVGNNYWSSDSMIFGIKFDQNLNIKSVRHFNVVEGNFEIANPMIQLDDGYIIPIQSYDTLNKETRYLVKTDYDFNIQWKKILDMNVDIRSAYTWRTIKTQNGFVTGARGIAYEHTQSMVNWTLLYGLDTIGNVLWDYSTHHLEDWCGVMGGVAVSDGGDVIYVSGKGDLISINGDFNWNWCFTKIDTNGTIKWRTFFRQPVETEADGRRLWTMTKLKNQQGYVSGGMSIIDSSFTYEAWIIKVGEYGDSLWMRNYYLESEPNKEYEVRQIVEDNTQNLIIVGERGSYAFEKYPQRGFLMRLDPYGCLVPGCHLVSANNPDKKLPNIKLYPNPADDLLAFYVEAGDWEGLRYAVYSMDGRLLKEGSTVQPDATYLLPVLDYPNGSYLLHFTSPNGASFSQPFIVQH